MDKISSERYRLISVLIQILNSRKKKRRKIIIISILCSVAVVSAIIYVTVIYRNKPSEKSEANKEIYEQVEKNAKLFSVEICSYPNCNSKSVTNGQYCIRHTCSVNGCLNCATGNTMFTYCSKHELELTCKEPGCWKRKYLDSDYCNMHYGKHK